MPPGESNFYQGFSGLWSPGASSPGTAAVGGAASFEVKSQMSSLLRDLKAVDSAIVSITKNLKVMGSTFEAVHRQSQGQTVGPGGGGAGSLTSGAFTRAAAGARNLLTNMPGALWTRASGLASRITAGGFSGGNGQSPTGGGGGSGGGGPLTFGARAEAYAYLGNRVGGIMQSTLTPGVSADFMARQLALYQGVNPNGVNLQRNLGLITGAARFNTGASDLAQGFGILQNQLGRPNAGQTLQSIRNASQLAALMPQLGFAGGAGIEANLATAGPLINRLAPMGAGLIGRGGRIGNTTDALRTIGLYLMYGTPNANVSARQASRNVGLLSGQNAGALRGQSLGLDPQTIQAIQQYFMYSGAAGHYVNLGSASDMKASGVTGSFLQSFNTLQRNVGNAQMATGLAAEPTQEAFNTLQGGIAKVVGNVMSSPAGGTLAGFGLALGNVTKDLAELGVILNVLKVAGLGGAAGAAGEGGLLAKLSAGSIVSKLGGPGALLKGGAIAAGGSLVSSLIANAVRGNSSNPHSGRARAAGWLGSVGKGAAIGAGIGALGLPIPILGEVSTAGGALIGGAVGALGHFLGDGAYARRGDGALRGPGHASGMQSGFQSALVRMFHDNPNLVLNSGYRSYQQQAALYAAYKSGKGNLAAPPGQSMHELGLAADIGPSSQYGWLASNAKRYGLYIPMPSQEPWHIQPLGSQGTGATEAAPTTSSGNVTGNMGQTNLARGFAFGNQWGSVDAGSMLAQILATPGGPNRMGSTTTGIGGGTSTVSSTPAGAMSPNSSVVAAVKAVTADPHVRLAMLMGSALESNQNPNAVGSGSYGAWQIQMLAGRNVTPSQAQNNDFAARFMVGAYTSAVARVPGALWNSNPQRAAEMAAFLAEKPAADYYATQGSARVSSAYALAKSEVGDAAMVRSPRTTAGAMGGGVRIYAPISLTITSASDAEAQRFAQVVANHLQKIQSDATVGSH